MLHDVLLTLPHKSWLGGLAAFISFLALIPYIRNIFRRHTQPHIFTWLIWGISTLTVFAAQWTDHAGAGSWSTAIGGVMTFVVIGLAWKYNTKHYITKTDWYFLGLSFAALMLWGATDNPLHAVILLTLVDTAAYVPTFRKSWHRPHTEALTMYNIMTIRNLMAIAALEHYSLTTLLFPFVTSLANTILVVCLLIRRHMPQAARTRINV